MTVMQVTGPKKNKEKRIGTVEFDLRDCVLASAASRCAPALPRPAPDYECFRGSFGARMAHYTPGTCPPCALPLSRFPHDCRGLIAERGSFARTHRSTRFWGGGTHRRTRVFFGDSSQSAGLFWGLIAERGTFLGTHRRARVFFRPCVVERELACETVLRWLGISVRCRPGLHSCSPCGYSLLQLQSRWIFPTAAAIPVEIPYRSCNKRKTRVRGPASPRRGSTAATPVNSPYCSCTLINS